MNEYLSHKLENLSALLILMVVYIHMYYTEGAAMPGLGIIEGSIGGALCLVAVPLFYIISGYLFFVKVPNGLNSIFGKMKKRCKTLLVPYILANIFTFLFYVTLNYIALRVPSIDNVVNFKVFDTIEQDGWWETIYLVFISPPIAFQLWFVRDLMVIIAFSPIIYYILKISTLNKTGFSLLLFFLFLIFIFYGSNDYIASAFWFISGGAIAMGKFEIENKSVKLPLTLILVLLYLTYSLCIGFGVIKGYGRYLPIIGIPALWFIYDYVYPYFKTFIIKNKYLVSYTFFVYLIHEPLLNIFKKIPLLFDRSEPTLIASYIIIPIIFYISACWFGIFIKRAIPQFYKIYTGGR